MPHFVHTAEVFDVHDESAVLVDSVVSPIQAKGGEIGEHVDEYLVRNLEYCEAAVRSQTYVDSERGGDVTWTCLEYRFDLDLPTVRGPL